HRVVLPLFDLSLRRFCLVSGSSSLRLFRFFLNGPAPPDIYTLSLHDALPISTLDRPAHASRGDRGRDVRRRHRATPPRSSACLGDRKSTRLNSSHVSISYAVFCLKKKKQDDEIWERWRKEFGHDACSRERRTK